jgi:hypothetical protein
LAVLCLEFQKDHLNDLAIIAVRNFLRPPGKCYGRWSIPYTVWLKVSVNLLQRSCALEVGLREKNDVCGRGTPRRHLLTTGWSTFVNQKKLVAGDAIVFLRSASGELCVGVRRSMRGTTGSDSSAWHSSTIATSSVPVRPSRWEVKGTESFSDYLDAGPGVSNTSIRPGIANASSSTSSFARNRARVTAKSVLEAATLAVAGKQFEVVYYPRASTAEFCVKAALVKQALDHNWYAGMRFKMAFETEDSSRISWFMGTISAVQPADPLLWPKSPWRVLQVTWDEPDLLQGVGRASPWQVELVATLPMQLPPFPLPKKKPRPALPSELLHLQAPGLLSGLPTNNFVSGQLPPLTEDASAGMQGARHDRIYGLLVSDFPTSYKHSRDFIPDTNFFHAEHDPPARTSLLPDPKIFSSLPEHLSLPAAELQSERSATTNKTGPRSFFLFGQSINPAQSSKPQLQLPPASNSSDGLLLPTATGNWLLQNKQEDSKDCIKQFTSVPNGRSMGTEGRLMLYELNGSRYKADQLGENLIGNLEWLREPVSAQGKDQISGDVTFLCKVFRESEEVGRTLDLSKLATYEELYERLAAMFSIPKAHLHDRVVYKADGFTKGIGQEPYRNFATSVRRITILSERERSFDTLS